MPDWINDRNLADLHLHLDGSLSVDIIRKLADIQNIPLEDSDDELRGKLQVEDGCTSLNEYLTKFDFPLTFLQTKEGIEESVCLLLEELKEEGLVYAEIRFAPQLHLQKGLTQKEVVESALKGLGKSEFSAALILCCMRGAENHAQNLETVRLAAEYLNQGVCAVDLAGAEALFPTEDFEEEFKLARELHVPFTIHAGEAAGPESIRKAIEYGATRIGHGVRAFEDAELMKELAEKGVALELCPTSNLNTAVFSDIKEYPLRKFMDAGMKVTINTDNRMVSNTTLQKEYALLIKTFALTQEEVRQLMKNSMDAAFNGPLIFRR